METTLGKLPPGTYTLREIINEGIIKRVDANPLRLAMNYFVALTPDGAINMPNIQRPECGTVCCAAGHGYHAITGKFMDPLAPQPEWQFLSLLGADPSASYAAQPDWVMDLRRIFYGTPEDEEGYEVYSQTREETDWLIRELRNFLYEHSHIVDRVTVTITE